MIYPHFTVKETETQRFSGVLSVSEVVRDGAGNSATPGAGAGAGGPTCFPGAQQVP